MRNHSGQRKVFFGAYGRGLDPTSWTGLRPLDRRADVTQAACRQRTNHFGIGHKGGARMGPTISLHRLRDEPVPIGRGNSKKTGSSSEPTPPLVRFCATFATVVLPGPTKSTNREVGFERQEKAVIFRNPVAPAANCSDVMKVGVRDVVFKGMFGAQLPQGAQGLSGEDRLRLDRNFVKNLSLFNTTK